MINFALVLWIVLCIVFVTWSSGKLEPFVKFVMQKACDLVQWAKGTWRR
jgi:hypothetical protein